MFRDQTQNVVRKAKKAEARAVQHSSKPTPVTFDDPSSEEVHLNPEPQLQIYPTPPETNYLPIDDIDIEDIPIDDTLSQTNLFEVERYSSYPLGHIASLLPTTEDRATSYFISNYAVGIIVPGITNDEIATTTHFFDILDPTLTASVKAASLASYAHHVRSTQLTNESRYQYMKALQMTNAALSTPGEATKDSTLLSTILLGLYEVLTGPNERSLKDWAEHAHGAAALLKLRGRNQFQTPFSRRMFLQATGGILASCLQWNIRVPQHVVDMIDDLAELMRGLSEYAKLGIEIFQIMIKFNQFQCDIREGLITDPEEIIAMALELDAPLQEVYDDHPPEWVYETFTQPDDLNSENIIYKGQYHIYNNLYVASVWNNLRLFRIMLNQTIRGYLLEGFSAKPPRFTETRHTTLFQQSTEVCYKMQADILATVPQSLGYIRTVRISDETSSIGSFSNSSSPSSDGEMTTHIISSTPNGPRSGGYSLLWPLWYAGFIDLASEDVKEYCITNLRRVGEDMGIQQANVLAKVIEKNREPKVWSKGDLGAMKRG